MTDYCSILLNPATKGLSQNNRFNRRAFVV
jgi:hypothetical protein